MSENTASKGRTSARRSIIALALCGGLLVSSAWSGDTDLRPSSELDAGSLRRLGRIGEDESHLLRVEWKTDLSRVSEQEILDDILTRLTRIEATTRDLFRLVQAIPAKGARAPAPSPVVPPAPVVEETSNPLLMQAGLAGGVLLLLSLWLLRRRASKAPRVAVATEPTARPAPATETTPSHTDTPAAEEPTEVSVPLRTSLRVERRKKLEAGMGETAERIIERRVAPPLEPTFDPASTVTLSQPSVLSATPAAPTGDDETAAENDGTGNEEALQLAEIMLSMGLAAGAAKTLTEHIRTNPKQALYHWLKLLDIHRKGGNKIQFEQSSRELQQHFNIQPEDWVQSADGATATLEHYARIATHIVGIWKRPPEALSYLKHLLEDNRGGTRAGFPQPVAEEILLLIAILKETWGRT
jgi:hypothetical protein